MFRKADDAYNRCRLTPGLKRWLGRWRAKGLARTTLINQATLMGYHLGVDPARLASWYRGQPVSR